MHPKKLYSSWQTFHYFFHLKKSLGKTRKSGQAIRTNRQNFESFHRYIGHLHSSENDPFVIMPI